MAFTTEVKTQMSTPTQMRNAINPLTTRRFNPLTHAQPNLTHAKASSRDARFRRAACPALAAATVLVFASDGACGWFARRRFASAAQSSGHEVLPSNLAATTPGGLTPVALDLSGSAKSNAAFY